MQKSKTKFGFFIFVFSILICISDIYGIGREPEYPVNTQSGLAYYYF